MEDLQSASKLLLKALKMRERYMRLSRQKFPNLVEGYIRGCTKGLEDGVPNKATIEGKSNFYVVRLGFQCSSRKVLKSKGESLVQLLVAPPTVSFTQPTKVNQ